jgi:replicative DNA helicase
MNRLADLPLFVDDSAELSLSDVRAKARRLKADHGAALIVIDYLQLLKTERGENRNLEVAALSRGLKVLARDLELPIVVLSQLSREPDKRTNHRPQLADLRDSGSLEQDADVVLFVHRPAVYGETDDNRNVAEIWVGKQRNGPTGMVRLDWINHLTRFEPSPLGYRR